MEQTVTDKNRLAEVLFDAFANRKQLAKETVPASLEKEDAYRVQHALTALKDTKGGEKLKGYKISLTSPETQELFKSDSPLYGALTDSAVRSTTLRLADFQSPLIELELIFHIKEALSPTDGPEELLQKTAVAPGIEVPDSRFEDWFPKLSLGQVIADSAVAGNIVSGEPKEGVSFKQLDGIGGQLLFNGEEIAAGSSAEVLGHPVHALKWLVDELHGHGLALEEGMAVSSGTFILPKALEKGTYEGRFDGIGSVTVEVI